MFAPPFIIRGNQSDGVITIYAKFCVILVFILLLLAVIAGLAYLMWYFVYKVFRPSPRIYFIDRDVEFRRKLHDVPATTPEEATNLMYMFIHGGERRGALSSQERGS